MITFLEIDARRREKRFSQKELCRRADIHETTYCRLKKGTLCGNVKTLGALSEALNLLIQERGDDHVSG